MKRLASLALTSGLLATTAAAEVAVKTDYQGHFVSFRTGIQIVDTRVLFWDQNGGPTQDSYLNPAGDFFGDSTPFGVVQPAGKTDIDPSPIVVWTKYQGTSVEVVFSRWTRDKGWALHQTIGPIDDLDDHDVNILLDPRGDVHAVWWKAETVPGVYYSKFADGAWSTPVRLSDAIKDSRQPSFLLTKANELYILWEDVTFRPPRTCSFLKEHFDP